MYSDFFFSKIVPLCNNVEKYGRAGQATYDNMDHELFACWITKVTNTHCEYVILIAFPLKQWLYEFALVLTFVRTVPLLYISVELPHIHLCCLE